MGRVILRSEIQGSETYFSRQNVRRRGHKRGFLPLIFKPLLSLAYTKLVKIKLITTS